MSVPDAAALAVFRNAHLPPGNVVVTPHRRPAGVGG